MFRFLKKINPYVILLIVVVFGYWQISFFNFALKWDVIDVVFPFRFYFSESIQSGYFPFWNPYQQTGTPFFADLQAPTFYPELLFTSLFTGYGIYTMHILFVLYLALAATGMFQLSFHFNKSREASLIAGVAYALSGYLIGHGQHFFLLVGAAWIPFVIVNYLKLQENRSLIQTLKTAVFIFLMISGAYQALSFTLFYLLILLFVHFILKESAKKNYSIIKEFLKVNFWLFLIVVAFSLPLVVATLEILTSVDRLESGITLSQTAGYGQSVKSVLSFLLPFSTLKYGEFFGNVDVSMRNHFFGLIPLVLLGAALLQKRRTTEYLILGFGLVIFAASFSALPVRELLFKYVPFMNLFKYAAFIRIFGVLAFILISANYFAYFQKNTEKEQKKVLALGSFVLLALTFLVIYSTTKVNNQEFIALKEQNSIIGILQQMSFYQHVLLQAIIQVFVCTAFLQIVFFWKKLKYPALLILLTVIAEMFIATQLNMAFTVGDHTHKPSRMNRDLALYPKKFPVPVDGKIIFNDQKHVSFPPFWRNTYVFSKQISFKSFSSFELKSYSKLDDEYHNLRDAVLNNHLFYFSEKIRSLKYFDDAKIDTENDTKVLYFSEEDFVQLSDKQAKNHPEDKTSILEFSPNRVVVSAETSNDQFLTMLQTSFKGWKAYIDNETTPIYTSNFNYRTIFLPKGKHIIRYEYKNTKILILYVLSNILFFLTVLFLAGYSLKKANLPEKSFIYIPLAILLATLFFLAKRLTYTDPDLTIHEIYAQRQAEKNSLFHYRQYENEIQNDNSFVSSGEKGIKINPEDEYFNVVRITNESGKLKKGTLVVTAKIYPEGYSKAFIVSDISPERTPVGWHASRLEKQIEKPYRWNKVIYFRNIYDLKEEDVISVYFWNPNRAAFRVDDIEVNFYP